MRHLDHTDNTTLFPEHPQQERSSSDFSLSPEDRPSVRTTTDADMRAAEQMALWIASNASQRQKKARWNPLHLLKKRAPLPATFAVGHTQKIPAGTKAAPQIILPTPRTAPSTGRAVVPLRRPRLPWKKGMALLSAILIASSGIWEWKSQGVSQTLASFYNGEDPLTSQANLVVRDIYVSGRVHTKAEEILAALGIGWGDPILKLDLDAAKERIEKLPWIKKAAISRQLAGTIHIDIVERVPIAIWQNDGHFTLVDAEGQTIDDIRDNLYTLPLVVGTDANKHAATLLATLREEPQLMERVKAAVWVGNRRWNLIFDDLNNGLNVRLPEEGTRDAWKRLASLSRDQKVLDRALTMIDLRLPDRMILGVSPQALPKISPQGKTKDRDI